MKAIIDSPLKIIGLLVATIFSSELIIMSMPWDLITDSHMIISVTNALLLPVVLAPMFFKFVYKPMTGRIKKLQENHREMVAFQIQQQIYYSVFTETSEAVMVTDTNGKIVAANPAVCALTGFSEDELMGSNPRILASGKHDQPFYKDMWNGILTTGHWQGEIWNRRKSGEVFAIHATISKIPKYYGETTNFVSVFHDITNRKVEQDELHHKAHHDVLTGLPNRMVFEDRLEQVIANTRHNEQTAAVLFLDLDKFKPVNDTFGHGVGDKLLVAVSTKIQEIIRKEDTLARIGGDEFTIIFRSIAKSEDAGILAQKIIDTLTAPFEIDGHEITIGVSIGIAIYPVNAETMDGLLLRADSAMYAAKNSGRNTFRYYEP